MRSVDKNFRYVSPDEFLGLIRDAEYVVTNSFHAIAFSLIFHVKFLALGRTEKLNSRIINLLRSLQLEQLYLRNAEFDKRLMQSIDFDEVEKRIDDMKQQSKRFIENALSAMISETTR